MSDSDNYRIVVEYYSLFDAPNIKRFSDVVNKAINEGWEPCGGVAAVPTRTGEAGVLMMQAMTRYPRMLYKPKIAPSPKAVEG